MNKAISMVGGAGFGAGLMYFLDPDRGKGRRALVRDQAARSARKTHEAAEATAWDARNRAQGIASSMKSWIATAKPVSDDVLVERVRSKLGMIVRHPGSIEVTARNGIVTLNGPVLADELEDVIRIVSRVAGVTDVENRLDIHADADNISGLQGGPARRPGGEPFELMQSRWSPSARFLTAVAGSAAAFYGGRQRTAIGAAMTVFGLGLLARSVTNRDLARPLRINEAGIGRQEKRRHTRGRGPEGRTAGKRLKDVMTTGVEVIHPDASLEHAAEIMKTLNVGALPVCDGDRLVGMVTDRDIIVRIIAEHRDPKTVTVRDAMTPDVAFCFENDGVQEAAMLMADKQIRRLVVLNRDKRLVGIVSLGDLAVHTHQAQLSGEVLEYVSEPAEPRR